MAYLTYKYRIYPTKAQERAMLHALRATRHLYNMALETKILEYQVNEVTLGKFDLYKFAARYKKTFANQYGAFMFRDTINILIEAYNAFFKRVKKGGVAGFPKFKGAKFWSSFGFADVKGWKIDGKRVYMQGIGRVRVNWHRPMTGTPKTMRVIYRAKRWYAVFACEVGEYGLLPLTERAIGIDVGIASLLTLSDGRKIDNPKWYQDAQDELRRKQRALARAVKGSNNRKKRLLEVQRLQEHIANQRKDFFDKLVYQLVNDYDLIALEDLQIKNMVKNEKLSKSILDAGWGYFRQRLIDKAAQVGKHVVIVDPRYTSKSCSNCGTIFDELPLSQRWVNCDCGMSMDRDHNAAINILNRGLQKWEGHSHVA